MSTMMMRIGAVLIFTAQFAIGQLSGSDLGNLPAQGTASTIAATPTTAGVVRQASWSHPGGNLVANWSFENDAQFWASGTSANVRYLASSPWTGKYVAILTNPGSTTSNVDAINSAPIRLKPGQTYTLSLMYRGATGGATITPRVTFYRVQTPTTVLSSSTGSAYSVKTAWEKYVWTLPVQNDEVFAVLTLANGPRPTGIAMVFDGVVLAEGTGTGLASLRDNYMEAVTISDPTGIGFHSMIKSQKDTNYLLQTVGYDAFWRPESGFLPYTVSGTGIYARQADPYTASKTYHSPAAGSTPFSQTVFPTQAQPWVESALPGDAYAKTAGKTTRSGSALVATVPVGAAQMYADPANPPQPVGEAKYVYRWSRDNDGYFSASWTDKRGLMIQSATQIKASGTSMWAFSRYEYYPNGAFKRRITPLNYSEYMSTGAIAAGSLAPVSSYDQAGRVIAKSSPDEGVVQYWYDIAGRLRFKQLASQIATNKYTYYRYDVFGRLISEGELVNASLTQANAEDTAYPNMSPSYTGTDKPGERKGWIYDELNTSKWTARIPNVTLATVIGSTTFAGRNGLGRLVAKYHRNPDYSGMDLDEAGKLIVDLYGYDTLGRKKVVGKYLGAVTDAADRRHSQEYRFDSAGRVSELLIDKNMDQTLVADASRQTDQWYKYTYDDKGRIATIHNRTTVLARYSYDQLGRMTQVILGSSSLTAKFAYSLHSRVSEINAGTTAASRNYIENLSYESAPTLGGVDPIAPRYNGLITRTVEQFTNQNVYHQAPARAAGTEPLKVANNGYDPAGRQTSQYVYVNRENATYNASTGVATAPNHDYVASMSQTWDYDANDRLTKVVEMSDSYYPTSAFNYTIGSNKLNSISGCLNPSCSRDASSENSFTYNEDGQQTADNSASRCQNYDAEGLVTKMGVGTSTCGRYGTYINFLQDADGLMEAAVTRDQQSNGTGTTAKHFYVRLGGVAHKEILEVWNSATNVRTSSTKIINLMGASSVIGRRLASGEQQFYIKNHLGSVAQVVKEDGSVVATFDFRAMGELRTLRGDDPRVTNKFTGKEFFEGTGLYYFGARWYDPQLGMWISPDPAGQFMSPYAYGPDFINGVDPNGMLWDELSDAWDATVEVASDVSDVAISVTATVGINVVGIGGCALSGGTVCAVGYYDHSEGNLRLAGGGITPIGAYGWAGTVNFNTGSYALGGVFFDPVSKSAGGGYLAGNWNTGRFEAQGAIGITRGVPLTNEFYFSGGVSRDGDGNWSPWGLLRTPTDVMSGGPRPPNPSTGAPVDEERGPLADINGYIPRDNEWWTLAENRPDHPQIFEVYGHSPPSGDGIMIDGVVYDWRMLANKIKSTGTWAPGMPIWLYECNAAYLGVQKLADYLQVNVWAPTSYIWGGESAGDTNIYLYGGKKHTNPDGTWKIVPDYSVPGYWRKIRPTPPAP